MVSAAMTGNLHLFKVTPATFWLKCVNLPKFTKFCSTRKLKVAEKNFGLLTLPFPSLLVPTPFTKGGGEVEPKPPSYFKNRRPHEREIF